MPLGAGKRNKLVCARGCFISLGLVYVMCRVWWCGEEGRGTSEAVYVKACMSRPGRTKKKTGCGGRRRGKWRGWCAVGVALPPYMHACDALLVREGLRYHVRGQCRRTRTRGEEQGHRR
jgi:hypothetical protein